LSTDTPNAFFSYSREDSQFALRLAEDLKAGGANVWLDQLDIQPGQRWARAVEEALNSSPRLIVILSPTSAASTNVSDEVNFALEEHKTIIPVMYRDCKVPFQLRPFQYVDFRTDYEHGLNVMLRTLGVGSTPGRAAAPQASAPKPVPNAPPAPAAQDTVVRVEPEQHSSGAGQRTPFAAPDAAPQEQQAPRYPAPQWTQTGLEAERFRATREPMPPADDFAERRRAQEPSTGAAAQRAPLPQPPPQTPQPPVQAGPAPTFPAQPQTGFARTGNKIGLAAAGLVIVILVGYWIFHPSQSASDAGKSSSLNPPAAVKPAEPPPQDNNANTDANAANSEPPPVEKAAPSKPEGRETRLRGVSPNAPSGKINASESSGSLGMPEVSPKFADLYQKAQHGDTAAMVQIGYNYGTGQGVPVDYKKAIAWYRKAADNGSAHGMYDLGVLYQNGLGVKKDYRQAFELYQKAADAGDRDAMDNLGFLYQNGWGVTRDYDQAATWYRKAADAGNPNAMANLSVMYQNGQGVSQDYRQAFFWDRKAAEAGNPDAMLGLGVLYENGRGTTQDFNQAINWYTKAGEAGQSMGINNLAVLYETGKGVPKDQEKAVALYRRAARLGNPKAKENLSRLGVSP
jgi:TPR repeat protein